MISAAHTYFSFKFTNIKNCFMLNDLPAAGFRMYSMHSTCLCNVFSFYIEYKISLNTFAG